MMRGAPVPDFERRQQILAAAEQLLCRYGPAKTTVADVAREAGVSVGSVYLEFSSKDDIVEELSASSHRKVLDAMRAEIGRAGRTSEERLRAALEIRVEAFLRLSAEGSHACDLFHCGNAAVRTAHDRFRTNEQSLLAEVIESGRQSGEFAVADVADAARTLLVAYMRLSPPWLYGLPRDDVPRLLRSLHDLVFRGLLARGESVATKVGPGGTKRGRRG